MKVLYLIKQEPDETVSKIMEEQGRSNEMTVINLKTNKDYNQIIDLIEATDKVISW